MRMRDFFLQFFKQFPVSLLLCLVLAMGFNSCRIIYRNPKCKPEDKCTLPVDMLPQMASNWCWAASGEMCMESLNGHKQVCQVDQAESRCRSCGNSCRSLLPPEEQCDPLNGFYPYDAEQACNMVGTPYFYFGKFYSYATAGFALSWEDLRTEIYCNHRPVIFTWSYWVNCKFQHAHIMVAYGYVVEGKQRKVYVHDPAQEDNMELITYEEYARPTGGVHNIDYYHIVSFTK